MRARNGTTDPSPLLEVCSVWPLVSLLSTSLVLAQAPIVRNELHHEVAKPLRELAVNPRAMPSRIREAEELEMLALTPGFKNM